MALISVVVPVYYNAESLPLLVERLSLAAEKLTEDEFEFVFTDDGSGDSSFSVLQNLAQEDQRIRLVKLSRNFGSNAAILAGLTYATGDCSVVISADLQDPPELIPELVASWKQGKQVVLAARRTRQDPTLTKFFATMFNRLFRKFVFADFPPDGFDFMLIDRCVVDLLVQVQEKNSYIFGQTMWAGFQRNVVYYDRRERGSGQSRWTTAKKIKYFIDAFSSFSYLPLRMASLLGLLLAFMGFIYALVVIGLRVTMGFPIVGWASLMVVVLLASGAQLVVAGTLGEYLWRILDETRRRPPFIVDSLINIETQNVSLPHNRTLRQESTTSR